MVPAATCSCGVRREWRLISCGGSSSSPTRFSECDNLSNLAAAAAVLRRPRSRLRRAQLDSRRCAGNARGSASSSRCSIRVNSNRERWAPPVGLRRGAGGRRPRARRLCRAGEAALRYHRAAGEQAERSGSMCERGRAAGPAIRRLPRRGLRGETPNQARRLLQTIGNPATVLVRGRDTRWSELSASELHETRPT